MDLHRPPPKAESRVEFTKLPFAIAAPNFCHRGTIHIAKWVIVPY